ncbi:DUF2231 domain-containing protein [Wenzhouxiangella sp. AB-CW3]|uniref:DUF2231 domain-containing protein n=1 Tax=Wenzhouxiangella sp. AB-CW3 TaxID=2771012 RepID=UPI00168B035D|nr:DUF2231 domain-containing protein [Wenzhouxiangella sp. AB-CW3]QOC21696.1 DUF2231 domain-containing protein [Wenzhouxiangella sp. AB-CW3]
MPREPLPDDDRESRVAIAGHPLHAMMVTFPIAFLMSVAATDLAWILLEDDFWARVSLWLVAAGACTGLAAGLAGTVELLLIPGVRRRGVSWSHFIAAVTLISIAFTNWFLRLAGPVEMILPWGFLLSLLGAVMVGVSGWLGANLVFDHKIGVVEDDGD